MIYGDTWFVVCRNKDVCTLNCKHREEHHPIRDGGCLPCDIHTHCCLDKNGEFLTEQFNNARCLFTRRGGN